MSKPNPAVLVWTRPGVVRTARAGRAVWRGVCGATSARAAAGPSTGTPLSGLHHKERWLSFGASLAKGETVKASAARCDVAVSTAFRWRHAERFGGTKGIVGRDLRPGEPEGRARAGTQGTAAGRHRGLSREQVPVLMAADRSGTTVSAVLPRVDAAALAAALDPVVAKDALLVSDGGASYPPCAAALGVSETLNRDGGTGSGRHVRR